MDIPASILEGLKCTICSWYLSRGPIFLQQDGAAICGRCYVLERPALRIKQYEATAKLLRFPCIYQKLGCLVTVPYAVEGEVDAHEEVCDYRKYVCPIFGFSRCDGLGPERDILQHCQAKHPDKVVDNPTTFVNDISKNSVQTYLLRAFEGLFLLVTQVSVESKQLFHAVRFLGAADDAENYYFTLDIKRNDILFSKSGSMAPPILLAIPFDGFDVNTFTVTVKRKVSDATKQLSRGVKRRMSDEANQPAMEVKRKESEATEQPARAVEKCAVCAGDVTEFRYRDMKGWKCERCAPAKRACKNKHLGCQHTDINHKRRKHEFYFCEKDTYCYFCAEFKSTHTDSSHQNITYKAGSTWRASLSLGCCLVSSVAGVVWCKYWQLETQFELCVYTTVPTERLREFRCVVRVTDPATGHSHTFTPRTQYKNVSDWTVRVQEKRYGFESWNTEFDVCVDITRL